MVAAHLELQADDKQAVLGALDPEERLELVSELLEKEIEIAHVDKKIRGRVKKQMETLQKEYFLREQVKAIQNLKIDKITVWDSGNGAAGEGFGGGSTSNFLKSLIGSLPPMQELAQQAGIELPQILGTVIDDSAGNKVVDEPSVDAK